MPLPLQVTETGDTMRFWVASEEYPNRTPYTVDLLENEGIGACTCKGFQARIWPQIRDGKLTLDETFPVHPDKHIQACRDHVAKLMYQAMAKQHGHAIDKSLPPARR